MSAKSKIEWTDATWNPVRGCSKVSQGCTHCYAERMFSRNLPGMMPNGYSTAWGDRGYAEVGRWTGRVELIESQLEIPLHWRAPRRIFVDSMSDTFHEALPDEAIDRIFAVMALCPQHTFMILTKRAERMLAYLTENVTEGGRMMHGTPPDWIYLGVSCEDQKTADERIPLLLQTPAAVRFVSLEPMIAPVSFRWAKWAPIKPYPAINNHMDGLRGIHLVIVGGESGPGARPCRVEWIRSVVEQCAAAGVACYVKQMGSFWARKRNADPEQWTKVDSKGGDPSE
mgnify:CR=1 FL=1